MLTSPPRSFFHHFASQDFQARTLEKKNLPRDVHVSKRNSRVFRRPEDSRSVNFPVKKLVSSIPPSPRPEITRVDRSVARQRRKNRFLPKKWTAATKMDNTFGNSWRFTMNRLGDERKKKSEYFIDNIGFYTNGKSMVPNLLPHEKCWKNVLEISEWETLDANDEVNDEKKK